MKDFFRCLLPIVLTFTAGSPPAFAQPLVCHPIQRGDTATELSRRLTGDGRNKYQPWFQIVDRSSRFVPKSQYDRIRPGWRACIVKAPAEIKAVNAKQVEAPGVSLQPASAVTVRTIDRVDFTMIWLGAAVVVPWLGWRILEDYIGRRRAVMIVMKHFAFRFVHEFERPLIQQDAERPVRSRLRFSPHCGRLDVLLAPGEGRRYPNLSDHKKNLEYDVDRVLRVLADQSFVGGPLYEQSGWVVVPFQFKVGPKQAGVTCISSF
jgi:hypothetical protein